MSSATAALTGPSALPGAYHELRQITKDTFLIHKFLLRNYLHSTDQRVSRVTRVTAQQATPAAARDKSQRAAGAGLLGPIYLKNYLFYRVSFI